MATRPLKLCRHPGCGRVAEANGYCKAHQSHAKQGYVRDKSIQGMYTHKWSVASKAWLAEHPWCEDCLKNDTYTPATEVHHKKKHRGNAALFWDKNNWMGLCHSCHSVRTGRGE